MALYFYKWEENAVIFKYNGIYSSNLIKIKILSQVRARIIIIYETP